MRLERNDPHRPAAIKPEDYEFVGQEVARGDDIGELMMIRQERERIAAHMKHTGGNYSRHEHGGNCMVCGSVNAIYTCLFYHAKTNSYVRMGSECTEKVYRSDFGMNNFRKALKDAREAQAGKNKAKALLADRGLTKAWDIANGEAAGKWINVEMNDTERGPTYKQVVLAAKTFADAEKEAGGRDGLSFVANKEERIVTDIVGKLIRYGSISDKQFELIGKLLKDIEDRPAREAQAAAEKAAAADAPEGAKTVTGELLTVRVEEGFYGKQTKMLVKLEDGAKVWGSMPAGTHGNRGGKITFKATFERSKDDPKFGFFKRPRLIEYNEPEASNGTETKAA